MCWRLTLEEYGPELRYIKGEHNVVADALSRLDMIEVSEIYNVAECFGYDDDDLPESSFPVRYSDISKMQQNDEKLKKKLDSHRNYTESTFRGGDKSHQLIRKNNRIVIPKPLQQRLVDWYHEMLLHPGATRTEQTI
jgi:hypothetical protein